ncbi:2041_t:CDS:1, partial [Cetraspora pellucida]
METLKQRQKRLTRERQRSFKRRRTIGDTKTKVEEENTNMLETSLNNNSIGPVESEIFIITNNTNTQ